MSNLGRDLRQLERLSPAEVPDDSKKMGRDILEELSELKQHVCELKEQMTQIKDQLAQGKELLMGTLRSGQHQVLASRPHLSGAVFCLRDHTCQHTCV